MPLALSNKLPRVQLWENYHCSTLNPETAYATYRLGNDVYLVRTAPEGRGNAVVIYSPVRWIPLARH